MPEVINVYDLPVVDNICNQTLREVISLSNFSLAHIIVDERNNSLWHLHQRTSEIYFILEGKGILYYSDTALKVEKGTHLILPKNTPHKLKNIGRSRLEHLVLTIPPFDRNDVKVLPAYSNEPMPKSAKLNTNPISALDGAKVYELMNDRDKEKLGISLAVGFLPAGRKAVPHYHKISEEIYYVIGGKGLVLIDEKGFKVRKGSVVHIPKNKIHALESSSEELNILCIASPSYKEDDFIFA